MTETTTPKHSPGVLAHAMRAVARHLFNEDLPAPISIRFTPDQDAVQIHLRADDGAAWVETLHIDRVWDDSHEHGDRIATHTHYEGRLPLGVRVQLLTVTFTDSAVQQIGPVSA